MRRNHLFNLRKILPSTTTSRWLKIALNSLAWLRLVINTSVFSNLPNAGKAITLSGQTSIRWIENKVNGYLNNLLQTENTDYVIASDTDSIYINFGPVVTKFLSSKSGEKAKQLYRYLTRSAKRNWNLLLNVHIRNLRRM